MKKERIFGVVLAVPEEISRRADRVRRFYDPNFALIGPHVTVLPPRPLALTRREMVAAVRRIAKQFSPVPLSLGGIQTFLPVMPVVFASVSRGEASLSLLHARLARGVLHGPETFPYVPHLTLGQNLDDVRLRKALALSRKVFASPAARLPWQADSLVIVERRTERRWISLPPLPLPGPEMTISPFRRRARRN